ncbi:DUF4331 domain-containing protein [Actinomadura barringtoniae]|uniref:DUF4331 domain-containing protein n=1 Tax=Actinomadura barringtoniae TaxID=1427535 RepID=A0A939PC19_9ACTN|nr:DUF4331 domain-containing protein [Actinomadura barringtoniae]MBO2449638.1 DUF4331 domain-containing protein [Actinomadura barringtoniae]
MKVLLTSTIACATAASALTAGLLAGPGIEISQASSHVDAPRLIADPQMDGSDLYAHTCPDDPASVCLIADYTPAQHGAGRPFADDARYEIHIDQNGDGAPDLTYRWTFEKPDARDAQHYTLEEIPKGAKPRTLITNAVAPLSRYGAAEARAAAVEHLPGGGRTLAFKAADPFFSNSNIVGLALTGTTLVPPIDLIQALNGNVNALALQIPKSHLALKGDPTRNPVIGVSTTAARRTMTLDKSPETYPQMSRLGNPSVDVLTFFSMGEQINSMSASQIARDHAFAKFVTEPGAPKLIAGQHYGFEVPQTPRKDLWQTYLTGIAKSTGPIQRDLNSPTLNRDADPDQIVPADELRLNMTTPPTPSPNRFGLLENDPQGFPNGRRINDDIQTSLVRMLMGEPLTDGAPSLVMGQNNQVTGPKEPVTRQFPYLAVPHA